MASDSLQKDALSQFFYIANENGSGNLKAKERSKKYRHVSFEMTLGTSSSGVVLYSQL